MNRSLPLFRPPAEADSLILRIADGCPWNRCTFCGMYKEVSYRVRPWEMVCDEIRRTAALIPHTRRVFLADGDVMALPFDTLRNLLELLNGSFPRLARVNLYANGHSILRKSDEELHRLRLLKLDTLYMGLESGDEATLREVCKRERVERMVEAGSRARSAGLKMSVTVLTGLAGRRDSSRHAIATAGALNRMQPQLLSVLRVIPVPGTALYLAQRNGHFQVLTEYENIEELLTMIKHLNLSKTVFRANHSSNIVPLEGRLPKDKERLENQLQTLLASGTLDTGSPGLLPLSL